MCSWRKLRPARPGVTLESPWGRPGWCCPGVTLESPWGRPAWPCPGVTVESPWGRPGWCCPGVTVYHPGVVLAGPALLPLAQRAAPLRLQRGSGDLDEQ